MCFAQPVDGEPRINLKAARKKRKNQKDRKRTSSLTSSGSKVVEGGEARLGMGKTSI